MKITDLELQQLAEAVSDDAVRYHVDLAMHRARTYVASLSNATLDALMDMLVNLAPSSITQPDYSDRLVQSLAVRREIARRVAA